MRPRQIEIRDSLFDPDGSVGDEPAQYREGNPARYRVFLFADGLDLPYVDTVTYYLHETFSNPTRVVARTAANPRCKLMLWTWGIFEVQAVITDKNGDRYEVTHQLGYDREIGALGSDPSKFLSVVPGSGSSSHG